MLAHSHNKCFNVFVFGELKSGKTSLINRIIDGLFSKNTSHTKHCNYLRKQYSVDDRQLTIKFWDTLAMKGGDHETKRRISDISLYKYANLALVCVSVLCKQSLESLHDWISFIQESTNDNCRFIIVLTKVETKLWEFSLEDLEDKLRMKSIVSLELVSSQTGRGIADLESKILEEAQNFHIENEKQNNYEGRFSLSNVSITSKTSDPSSRKCC